MPSCFKLIPGLEEEVIALAPAACAPIHALIALCSLSTATNSVSTLPFATKVEKYCGISVEGVIGFYPVSAENPVTIPTYRCFLQSDDTFDVIPLDLSTTSIESVVKENRNSDRYYDLLGRGVKSLEKGGVYVKKGEKVLKR